MEVYRITNSKYAGILHASGREGRWNRMGEEVIYCASSRSLAALELLVHLSGIDVNNQLFSFTIIDIPDELFIDEIRFEQFEDISTIYDSYKYTQLLGSKWYKTRKYATLKVPSSIIRKENNFILNTHGPGFERVKVLGIEPFDYDKRLLK